MQRYHVAAEAFRAERRDRTPNSAMRSWLGHHYHSEFPQWARAFMVKVQPKSPICDGTC